MDWKMALGIFVGTLPLLGVILWSLLDFRAFKTEIRGDVQEFKKEVREEFRLMRAQLSNIQEAITDIKERLATLEERDRVKLR